MKKEDFVKIYFEKKDSNGILSFEEILKRFKLQSREFYYKTFEDSNGLNFLKKPYSKSRMDAELIFSRIYAKNGFVSAKYFPLGDEEGNVYYIASPNICTEDTVTIDNFDKSIFKTGENVVCDRNMHSLTKKDLSGAFTDDAVKSLLLMRLFDVASFNNDRHIGNYFYKTHVLNGERVVDGVKTFDYGASGIDSSEHERNYMLFYNNSVSRGEKTPNCNRKCLINMYKEDEAVQFFLPKEESAEILGNVDFNKEATLLKQEMGCVADQKFLDLWQKSFDNMAEDLSK